MEIGEQKSLILIRQIALSNMGIHSEKLSKHMSKTCDELIFHMHLNLAIFTYAVPINSNIKTTMYIRCINAFVCLD